MCDSAADYILPVRESDSSLAMLLAEAVETVRRAENRSGSASPAGDVAGR